MMCSYLLLINLSFIYFLVGPIQRMDPLNQLQIAIKNNVDVFYFVCLVPFNTLWVEDGQMGKRHGGGRGGGIDARNSRFFFYF